MDGHKQDGDAVDGKESTDRVELSSEDLEDDQCKGELPQGRTDVCAFKGALGSA